MSWTWRCELQTRAVFKDGQREHMKREPKRCDGIFLPVLTLKLQPVDLDTWGDGAYGDSFYTEAKPDELDVPRPYRSR